jgi:hypothetical protein
VAHLFPDFQSVRIAVSRFWPCDPKKQSPSRLQHKKPLLYNFDQPAHNFSSENDNHVQKLLVTVDYWGKINLMGIFLFYPG